VDPRAIVRLEGLGQLENDLPACSIDRRQEGMGEMEVESPLTLIINMNKLLGASRLCGLVLRVSGYTAMYCASCEVRTEFIYVM
jgi:hypothetical protein